MRPSWPPPTTPNVGFARAGQDGRGGWAEVVLVLMVQVGVAAARQFRLLGPKGVQLRA